MTYFLSILKTRYTLVGGLHLPPFDHALICSKSWNQSEILLSAYFITYWTCPVDIMQTCPVSDLFDPIYPIPGVNVSSSQAWTPPNMWRMLWQLLTMLFSFLTARSRRSVICTPQSQFHIDAGPNSNANWWFLVWMCMNLTLCILGNQSIQIQFEWWSSHAGGVFWLTDWLDS